MSNDDSPLHHNVFGRMYLVNERGLIGKCGEYHCFATKGRLNYYPFLDDFGPMNLAMMWRFKEMLQDEIEKAGEKMVALMCDSDSAAVTNAVLLLGSYMVVEQNQHPEAVKISFAPISNRLISYRDISPGPQNFELTVADCWEAIYKAKDLSWVDFSLEGFDCEEYEHFDSPINADLHTIVPNKIIAMRGPIALANGAIYEDSPRSGRKFSPSHYVEILADFNVNLVVRLNEPHYNASEFEKHEIAVADLFFEDCTVPPDDIVVKFLLIVENLPGAAAVHCKAGLGRTGTLIAIYMMKNYGFSAREAIGWLRIVRPGSVIGQQQQYLCDMEAKIFRMRGHPMSGPHATIAPTPSGTEGSMAYVKAMVASMFQRVEQGKRRNPRQTRRRASFSVAGAAGGASLLMQAPPARRRASLSDVAQDLSAAGLAAHVTKVAQRRNSFRCPV